MFPMLIYIILGNKIGDIFFLEMYFNETRNDNPSKTAPMGNSDLHCKILLYNLSPRSKLSVKEWITCIYLYYINGPINSSDYICPRMLPHFFKPSPLIYSRVTTVAM
jgi:hypothetical protein